MANSAVGGFGLTPPVSVQQGGTGLATLTAHALYAGNGTSAPTALSLGTAGQELVSNGASSDPSFKYSNSTTTFNVRNYGAVGDGSTDDTSSINSAIAALNSATVGTLYFPATTSYYKTTAALTTITATCTIRGDGAGVNITTGHYCSVIQCNSATVDLFAVTSSSALFRDLAIVNNASGTPSAGSAIHVTGSNLNQAVCYDNILVSGFYRNIVSDNGISWWMRGCFLINAVDALMQIQNTVNVDFGDWSISDSSFFAGALSVLVGGIRILSSGGGKIVNCKFNIASPGTLYAAVVANLTGTNATSDLLVSNCSVENSTYGIIVQTTGSGAFYLNVIISGCEFLTNTAASAAIVLNPDTAGHVDSVTITGCVSSNTGSTSAESCIVVNNTTNVKISNCIQSSYASPIRLAGTYTGFKGDTGWHAVGGSGEPAFTNSWVNAGGGDANANFRMLDTGLVQLKGSVKTGTITTSAFTLPVGYRPLDLRRFAVASSGALGILLINSSGTVVPQVGSNGQFEIDVSFYAEQ